MKRKTLLILLCFFFLFISVFYGTRLFSAKNEYKTGEKTYEQLTQYVHLESSPDTVPSSSEPETSSTIDFESLQKINPDVVAWIYLEGTNINYPVVQGADNSYYLDHLFDGNTNSAGSIFMDYRNKNDLSDKNSIFYGHHMKNGTMFHQITKYKEQSFYDQHPTCLIFTPEKEYTVEFVAGYIADPDSDAWELHFASDEAFSSWIENAVSLSTFTSTVEPSAQDRVITFSTCSYEYENARYVLVGVLNQK